MNEQEIWEALANHLRQQYQIPHLHITHRPPHYIYLNHPNSRTTLTFTPTANPSHDYAHQIDLNDPDVLQKIQEIIQEWLNQLSKKSYMTN